MIGKTTYRRKLFIYFFVVFIVFTAAIAAFQYNREKQYKAQELESILNSYTDIVYSFIMHHNIYNDTQFSKLDSIVKILPRSDIRLTVIDYNGEVLYDSFYQNYWEMDNHQCRPEVQEALFQEKGANIRLSESTNQDFYYYAKLYDKIFVRAAVVYSISVREFLQAEIVFIYFIVFVFLITTGVLLYVSDKVGKSILKLKDFAVKAGRNEMIDKQVKFPENELGTIGNQIINIYNNLKRTNKELSNEKEKLIHHLQMVQEGIAIFSKNDEKILANNHFIQYLNLISDIPAINADHFLAVKEFKPIKDFIKTHTKETEISYAKTPPAKKLSLEKNKRYFEIQCIIFQDKSYEVSINDVTRAEKRKILKQQMTSNIAHELRTPVSSIKGYLETLLGNQEVAPEKQKYFIEKAAIQTERLSELIHDISMLTKIEESADLFEIEKVNIHSVINDVIENLQSSIETANATVEFNVKKETKVNGNKALIYSIFQNLMENSLKYAGEKPTISIDEYLVDDNYVYFSFSDNGVGIAEEHQSRVFERFYRVDKGRARTNGGTGLGLAIVKNAVQFHKGNISAKTRKGGGAEFLFSFKR